MYEPAFDFRASQLPTTHFWWTNLLHRNYCLKMPLLPGLLSVHHSSHWYSFISKGILLKLPSYPCKFIFAFFISLSVSLITKHISAACGRRCERRLSFFLLQVFGITCRGKADWIIWFLSLNFRKLYGEQFDFCLSLWLMFLSLVGMDIFICW